MENFLKKENLLLSLYNLCKKDEKLVEKKLEKFSYTTELPKIYL